MDEQQLSSVGTKETPLQKALNSLGTSIDNATGAMNRHTDRIAPVLSPMSDSIGSDKKDSEKLAESALVEQIRSYTEVVHELTRKINGVTDRLEL